MTRAYTLGDLDTIDKMKKYKPRPRVDESVAFSFFVEPNADKHTCYLAALDGMTVAEYEPREYACVKAILRYPSIVVRGALKASLEYYECVRAGLQAALGEDVQLQLVWRGDTSLTGGAVIEVKEIE